MASSSPGGAGVDVTEQTSVNPRDAERPIRTLGCSLETYAASWASPRSCTSGARPSVCMSSSRGYHKPCPRAPQYPCPHHSQAKGGPSSWPSQAQKRTTNS
jgi:hypothetical protein